MPDPETIIQLMDDYDLDRDQAEEIAELMEEHDIDDPNLGFEIFME